MDKKIGKVLKEARIGARMTVKEISEILTQKGYKASEKTVYSWETGNSQPSPDALLEMCDIYKIKDILTTFGYNGYKEDGSIQLNINEIDLIEKYRDLDPHGKEMVDFVLAKEWKRSISSSTGSNVISMPTSSFDHLESNAAHLRTDIEIPEGVDTSENDIMDDPDF